MKGIEKITDRIISEARADADAARAEAEAKAAQILADYEEQAKAVYDSRLESGKQEAAAAADRKVRAANLQSRKDVLSTKQDMIEQAYAMAKKAILRMPEDQYVDFLAEKAAKASVSGTEQIQLSEMDRANIGEKLIKAVNDKLAAQGKNAGITLADETAKIMGGLFLKDKDISVNCSVDSLLSIARESLDVKVAKVLFG